MAYPVSQDYKNLIASGAEQRILLLFPDAYFTNSQVSEGGVAFSDYFTTDENLTFGDCPSSAVSFSLISEGTLGGYGFGKMSAWIGVQTGSDPYAFGSQKAHIEVDGHTYDCGTDGVFIDENRLVSGAFLSLVSDTEYVYAIGRSTSLRIKTADLTWSVYAPNRIMAQRLQTPTSAVFDASTDICYIWSGTELQTWEYCPMGCYIINRPRKTTDVVVSIQDGHDYMSLFDTDSAEFISGLSYPITLGQIYTALCDYIGVEYVSATFLHSTDSYATSPFTSNASSCRDVLSWIAGKALCVAHFNRVGKLELRWLGQTSVESITTENLALNECDFAEYEVAPITGVLLKSSNGASLTFGQNGNLYPVYGNPFINTISDADLHAYQIIPSYKPAELRLINADPSVDCGDLVDVEPENGEVVLANQYGEMYVVPVGEAELRLYANENGEVLTREDGETALGHMAQSYEALYVIDLPDKLPLMHRELTFIGKCTATYEATGDRVREIDTSYTTEYNANVAPVSQMDVFNRLTNGGEQQGIYIEDGKIYVNAEYIRAGTLSADLIEGGTITSSEIHLSFSGAGTETKRFITGDAVISSSGRTYRMEVAPAGLYVNEIWTYDGSTMSTASYMSNGMFVQGNSYNGGNVPWLFYVSQGILSMQYNSVNKVQIYPDTPLLRLRDDNGRERIRLNLQGLYIYNADGTLKASYT